MKEFADNNILGETDTDIDLENLEENKSAAISLAKQARHNIDIFTQDMDAELLNNNEFEQAVFRLAKRHPNTRIRILALDSGKSVKNGHCLIRLAQNLTSSVFIHRPSREHANEQSAFIIVDQVGLLHRVSAANKSYKARLNFKSPQHAGKLLDFFNEAWEHSTPDIQARRVYL